MNKIISFLILTVFPLIIGAQSNPSIEFIGSTGGKVTDFAIYEDPDSNKIYCYIAQGAAIIIFDVTDHTNPVEVNRFFPTPSGFNNFSISENKMALTKGVNPKIYSLVNPHSPVLLGIIPVRAREVQLSGYKLQTQYEPEIFGSRRCFFGSSIFDISDLNEPVKLFNIQYCNASSLLNIPFFLFTADSKYNDPNFFWKIYHYRYGSIWFNANQYEIPVVQNETYFPDYLPSWDSWTKGNSPFGAVAYQNRLHLTFSDHVLTYDPRIQEGTQEFEILSIPDINGAPILDKNLLYIPTKTQYHIYDLSNPDKPQYSHTIPLPEFKPEYVNNGIAYSLKDDDVIIQSLSPFRDELTRFNIEKINGFERIAKFEVVLSLQKHTSLHPERYRDRELELSYLDYSILLSGSDDSFIQREAGNKFLYIHHRNFDPASPEYVEAYNVSANVGPQGRIEGNILILYNDDETYYFRLGGDLFSTSIPEWQLH